MNWQTVLTWVAVAAAFAFLLYRARLRLVRERAQQAACAGCAVTRAARRPPEA